MTLKSSMKTNTTRYINTAITSTAAATTNSAAATTIILLNDLR